MGAKFIPVGEPATENERNALQFLRDGLPSNYTVYGNPFLSERGGGVYELDAVVEAPHAIYVVEIKGHRGDIVGSDHDWWVPDPIRSPVPLNRKTAQILADTLRRSSYETGKVYVEGLVFLSQARSFKATGPVSQACVHLRDTILQELQNPEALFRRSQRGRTPPVDAHVSQVLFKLLKQPVKVQNHKLHGYELEAVLEQNERHTEWLARHEILRSRHVLRLYHLDPLASGAEQQKVRDRCAWEAQALARVARHPHILQADLPFEAEGQVCLPFEYFHGVTLTTWMGKHRSSLSGREGLKSLVEVWRKIAEAIAYAHDQGVIHRMLRPEVVLLKDVTKQADVRLTGFDLAKQLHAQGTVLVSTLTDDRLRWAAPEVLQGFSSAEPSSDQFALGALLGYLLAGRPLFEATHDLRKGRRIHLRDANSSIPQSLVKVVDRMLELRPADRFPSTHEAITAVLQSFEGRPSSITSHVAPTALQPEAIEEGTRIGPDYEIQSKLGTGGLATVYAARHLVSGARRALKVALPKPGADQALEEEYQALLPLNHPAIVRAVDLSNLIPDRKTLVLERVNGVSLSRWLTEHPSPNSQVLRRYAEDLFSALIYLESQGVIHKDLKPDNLIVGDDGLTVIDFSLARKESDDLLIGTSLYRDPNLEKWSHASDLYAAALCLHELFCGRHPFQSLAPSPGEEPDIDDTELEPPSLGDFFRRALSPRSSERFPSAVAMQAGFRQALGQRAGQSTPPPSSRQGAVDAALPLAPFFTEGTAQLLRRAGIRTQGELTGTPEETIRQLPNLGHRKRSEILEVRQQLLGRGVVPTTGVTVERRPLWPTLVGDRTSVQRLELLPAVHSVLIKGGYLEIGALADATREQLAAVPGIGPGRVSQIVGALQTFAEQASGGQTISSLVSLWEKVSTPLDDRQREVLEQTYGLRGMRQSQRTMAQQQGMVQSAVSQTKSRALERLDLRALEDVQERLLQVLHSSGDILRLEEAASHLEESYPSSDEIHAEGLVRLLCDQLPAEVTLLTLGEGENLEGPEVVVRPYLSAEPLREFLRLAQVHASSWPLHSPEAVRRDLKATLPEYQLDPLVLATRLLDDVAQTETGELFQSPIDPKHAVEFVLKQSRLPVTLAHLRHLAQRAFGPAAIMPEDEHLADLLRAFPDLRLRGDQIVSTLAVRSAEERLAGDELPPELKIQHKTPEQVVGELLRAASREARFRLVVVPPENHVEISRSVCQALGDGTRFVSFEHELLQHMDAQGFAAFEKAERFRAQRHRLTRAAEEVFARLLAEHGQPGRSVVLGDLGPLELCDARTLIRQLYDNTLSGNRGFWVVVMPGVIHGLKALFNENREHPVFSLPGATLPLLAPIPV